VATSNAVVYCGGTPVFADVDPETLLVDPRDIESKITPRTKAIVAMDYAGQPCDYDCLRAIADRHDLILVADSCHSLGASFKSHPIGGIADLTCFSFHPVKAITTCEGGAVTTNDLEIAARMKRFRSHGIDNTHSQRTQAGTHQYDMPSLGCNYRISDLQCALGISQLKKLPAFINARENIASIYQQHFSDIPFASLLKQKSSRTSAHHLVVMRWDHERSGVNRDAVFQHLRNQQIGVNVHYRPVYQHSWYQQQYGQNLSCPNSDDVYQRIITLPVFPLMKEIDVHRVTKTLRDFAMSITTSATQQHAAQVNAAS
jgi:perosamine synthetase